MKSYKLSITIFLAIVLCVVVAKSSSRHSMVWMCLERCGESSATIQQHLDVIKQVAPTSLTAVSFELYDLGNQSNIVRNPSFTAVHSQLSQMTGFGGKNLQTFPMITTTKIDYMRRVWKEPGPFIQQIIDLARENNYTGYNIDWEPEKGVESTDTAQYSQFLSQVSQELYRNNLVLNVDVASWTVLWNFTQISSGLSQGHRMITMDTYAGSHDTWVARFEKAYQSVPTVEQLGIGLMTVNPNTRQPLTEEDLEWRFGFIDKYSVVEVDIWLMDDSMANVGSIWWKFLQNYLNAAAL